MIMTRYSETYVDENGNKIVEPVYNGGGGTATGIMGVKRAA